MSSWLDSDHATGAAGDTSIGWPRAAVRILTACMLLLAAAAGWLVLTRPVHRIEGDFLQREDRSVADAWLLEQLRQPVAETRARAYLALGRIQGRSAAGLLVQGMADPAASVRAAAAFAAGNVFDARLGGVSPEIGVTQALTALLTDDERLAVTRAVAALGKLRSIAAVPGITRSAAPIATSMTALMRMEADDAIDFVLEYLDSDDQDSRWAAALAASYLRLASSAPVRARLLPLLADDNEFVRAAALRASAGSDPDEELVELIRGNLEHPDPKVSFEAANTLRRLAGESPSAELPAAEPALRQEPPDTVRGPLLEGADYQRVAKTIGVRLRMSTSLGDFDIELDYDEAPLTSEHFRRLAQQGAFDGTRFFAVRPNGYAAAGSGMQLIRSELNPKPFLRGSIGLLRHGGASGGGFFLCATALPLADGRYVNFGRLVSGDRRLDSITEGATVHSIRGTP